MKWYFALSQPTAYIYHRHVQIAVLSALKWTSLKPHFIYDGEEDFLTSWLRNHGVEVIFYRVPFYDRFKSIRNRDFHIDIAAGAFLRTQIPVIDSSDDTILYTDCDVMFLKEPFPRGNIRYFAAAPEADQADYTSTGMNTGVLFMNLKRLRAVQHSFTEFIDQGLQSFSAFDQGAYRIFFDGLWEQLHLEANWKPYWGINNIAEVIHFHGPKYEHIKLLLMGQQIGWKYECLFNADIQAYVHYTNLCEGYLTQPLVNDVDPYRGGLAPLIAGYLEEVVPEGNQIIVSGWAADVLAKEPARAVHVFVGGRLWATCAPDISRPDVANAHGALAITQSGFKVIVDTALKSHDVVQAFAEFKDGRFAVLSRVADNSGVV
jgi:hypothetical protein